MAASSAGRGAAGVSTESVDRSGRTKRQRSPERGGASEETEEIRGMPTESADRPGMTKWQMYPQDKDDVKTEVETPEVSAKNLGQSFSTACPEGERVKKVSRSEMASGMDGQGDVGDYVVADTLATVPSDSTARTYFDLGVARVGYSSPTTARAWL